MPKDSQARADQEAETMVDDPLDTSNVPDEGATELDNYLNEIDGMEMGDEDGEAQAPEDDAENLPHKIAVDGDELSDGEGEEEIPETETEEDGGDTADEEEEEEPTSKTDRFRIRAKDEVEAEALSIRKRHPEWSLKECIAKAEQVLGVPEQSAAQKTAEEEETQTVATISNAINELRSQRDEANASLEFETASDLQREIDAMLDQREELRYHEMTEKSQSQQREAESFEKAYNASEEKTVRFYPDTANPDSEMVARMIEIDAFMRENEDPNWHSPDKPFLLAKAAARELSIIMSDPSAKTKPVKAPQKNVVPVQPASGSARTTAPAPGRKLDDALESLDSLEDYEALVEAY